MTEQIEKKNVEWACKVLTEHNKWRRGQPPYDSIPSKEPLKPTEIGEAIDLVVSKLSTEADAVKQASEYLSASDIKGLQKDGFQALGDVMLKIVHLHSLNAQRRGELILEMLEKAEEERYSMDATAPCMLCGVLYWHREKGEGELQLVDDFFDADRIVQLDALLDFKADIEQVYDDMLNNRGRAS